MAEDFDRVLPNDTQIEATILGAVLMGGDLELLSKVEPPDFYTWANRVVAEALKDMALLGEPICPEVLLAKLRASDRLQVIGGTSHIIETIGAAPAVAPSRMRVFLDRLKELAKRRKIIDVCKKTEARAYEFAGSDVEPVAAIADSLLASVNDINSGVEDDRFQSIGDLLKPIIESTPETREAPPTTGVPSLDKATGGGMLTSRFFVLAGRPSMGKTAFALSMARAASRTFENGCQYGAHIVSLETDNKRLAARILGQEAGVSTTNILLGDLTQEERRKLAFAANNLHRSGLTLDDRPGMTLEGLRASIRKAQAKHATFDADGSQVARLGVVLIDYIQLLRVSLNKNATREQEVTEIATTCQQLAKEFKVCIVGLSQLNRAVESRTDKRPTLSDLRESGGIEQAADVVVGMYRDDYYTKKETGGCELIILKNKDGRTGIVRVRFHAETMSFIEITKEEEP
jgi:replicative DNA helicase